MHAMRLHAIGQPLVLDTLPDPSPGPGEIRLKVAACGVCRTDLHVVDGELPNVPIPITPGHEIIGYVDALGVDVTGFSIGQRVGAPWLASTCGHCFYCTHHRENLCDSPQFNGYTREGGFASHVLVQAPYAVALDQAGDDVSEAPLLCAGIIGWRSLTKAGDGGRVGLYGFGAAAHIVIQLLRSQGRAAYAFTRRGDETSQAFARSLGAVWTGASDETPPDALDAAIIYAPVGPLVPAALSAVRKGGRVVCAGIHMSDIPSFPYDILWGERELVSVANLTRQDGIDFFPAARAAKIQTHASAYPLAEANRALDDLRNGRLQGAAVLVP